jgi:hypothetical protein
MNPSVYVETGIISYLSARPRRDIVIAAHQQFNMKRRDPIIDELHRIREDIGKAHDFDVRRIAATIRRHEGESREGVVRESPKRTTRQKKAS